MLAHILKITNGAIRGLQIGAGFRTYKLRQEGLQIGQLKGFQIGAKRLQIGAKGFQIGAEITNRGKRDYKPADISNRGRDCKSLQNKSNVSSNF